MKSKKGRTAGYIKSSENEKREQDGKDRIEQLMLNGIENKISFKEFIKNEMLILFCTFLFIFVAYKSFLMILVLLPAIFYTISYIVIKRGEAIEGVTVFLYEGIFFVCFSFLWAVAGMALLFSSFSGKERIAVICIALIGYVASQFLFVLMIKRSIAKTTDNKTDNKLNKMLAGIPITLFGAFGMSLGRTFLKDLDSNLAMKIGCSLCFLISYAFSIGTIYFFKYRYIMKHPEILGKKTAKL